MEMTLIEIINNVLHLLSPLYNALANNEVETASNLLQRINPLLMAIREQLDPVDNSKLDDVLSRLIEIGNATQQCLIEVNRFTCSHHHFSAIRHIGETLQNIRSIVSFSPEETLHQDLENYFSTDGGRLRTRLLVLCSMCILIAMAAGVPLAESLFSDVPLIPTNK